MSDLERLEAIGSRGEACIVLRGLRALPDGTAHEIYTLATGERLKPTEAIDEFETLDGGRRFRLRRRAA